MSLLERLRIIFALFFSILCIFSILVVFIDDIVLYMLLSIWISTVFALEATRALEVVNEN